MHNRDKLPTARKMYCFEFCSLIFDEEKEFGFFKKKMFFKI